MSGHGKLIGRAGALLAAAAATSMVTVVAWTGDGVAAESRSLVAGASAQGMRVTYTVPDQFAVTEIMDGGGPVAQASVDTTGKAIGFASLPYPGDNGVTAPGLLTFATGQPIPAYPFYAEANHPTQPSAKVEDPSGSYSLQATAAAGQAAGAALVTFGGPEAPASRSTANATGATDATATRLEAVAVNEALNFGGGVLKINSVTSRSVTTYTAGSDKPETKNELLIEGARVGDQPVTIGPDGIHAGDQLVPGPVDGGASADLLKQAGITVRTVSSEPVDGGAALQILEVTVKHPIPGATVQGTLVYQIGGASSFIILGDEEPAIGIEYPASVEVQPSPAAGASSGSSEPAAAPNQTGSASPAPAGSPVPIISSPSGAPVHPAASRGTLPGTSVPEAPLPSPFDIAVPSADATTTGGAVNPTGVEESAAPSVAAEPVASIVDLRDQMRPLMAIAGLGGAALLAACAGWCLRRSTTAS